MEFLRKTKSVCPVCLSSIGAELLRSGAEIILSKTCEEHGKFEAVVWRGEPCFDTWGVPRAHDRNSLQPPDDNCPHNCGLCALHEQRTCTVLFELTQNCNLHCPVCFADAKGASNTILSLATAFEQLKWIRKQAGSIVLQLSGGEPTLYPYLEEVVEFASNIFPAVQLNTNGLLLAQDENLAKKLKNAGLSWVFLQCDGDTDIVHVPLRGKPLHNTKLQAIENCKNAGLSVVLVSVVVAGVNDDKLGDMLRFGLSFFPTVRGVHFQPMTLSGRNSFSASMPHITLPEIITKLSQQSHDMIKVEHAFPSSCEHVLCSFHCRYYVNAEGKLEYLRGKDDCACNATSSDKEHDAPQRTIESVIRSWKGESDAEINVVMNVEANINDERNHEAKNDSADTQNKKEALDKKDSSDRKDCTKKNSVGEKNQLNTKDAMDKMDAFDTFIAKAKRHTFSVTCMAFQDVHTLDLERLQRCCVHVYEGQSGQGRLIPFCAYNLTSLNGVSLYRR